MEEKRIGEGIHEEKEGWMGLGDQEGGTAEEGVHQRRTAEGSGRRLSQAASRDSALGTESERSTFLILTVKIKLFLFTIRNSVLLLVVTIITLHGIFHYI